MWALDHGSNSTIDKPGVTYRGEPPDWWFETDGAGIFRVRDGFLSEAEVASALDELSCKHNLRGKARSGLDMVCKVSASTMARLRTELEGEAEAQPPSQ